MKRILLISGSMLLLHSCVEATENDSTKIPSDDEMKSRVEVEEIFFEKNESAEFEDSTSQIIAKVPIDPSIGGCVLPKSELRNGSIPLPLEIGSGPDVDVDDKVYEFPEIGVQFPGGMNEFRKFIQENVKRPEIDNWNDGTVYVSAIIEKDGGITDLKIIRGLSEEINAEALRVVRSMPKWIPAKNNGKVVAAKVRLPISFKFN